LVYTLQDHFSDCRKREEERVFSHHSQGRLIKDNDIYLRGNETDTPKIKVLKTV